MDLFSFREDVPRSKLRSREGESNMKTVSAHENNFPKHLLNEDFFPDKIKP